MKIKKIILGLVTMMVMAFGLTVMSYADDVSGAKEIKPVDVTDFNDEAQMDSWQYSLVDDLFKTEFNENGSANRYYKFTIDKPAYVIIKAYSNIATIYGSDISLASSEIFTKDDVVISPRDSIKYSKTLLEPGTYYIKHGTTQSYNYKIRDDAQALFSVFKQDVERTGTTNGSSQEKAITLNGGNYGNSIAYGVASKVYGNQWFKLELNSKSDVKINVSTHNVLSGNFASIGSGLYELSGSQLNKIKHGGLLDETFTLEKGTYYIYTDRVNQITGRIKVEVDVKDVYSPETPVAKTYKSGSKFIKGNAEIGSTVYAKVGSKTYKAKTDKYGVFKITTPVLKVGNKISVYAKDEFGNKSVVTKITVKNRQLAAPKVKTAKKNTKLVKGTAKKGLTVYVTYNGKTVKKKLTSNNFSVKVSKKLVKGKAVKVKVVDAYGNYSKTVTYKVK